MDSENPGIREYHHFRLFSYMSMAILSIAILVGLFLIFQHLNEEDAASKTIANQETLIENQNLLKELLSDAKGHELREEAFLGNNTRTNIKISSSNSDKLDLILDHFNLTSQLKE